MNNKVVEQTISLIPKKLYWDQQDIPNYVLNVNGIDVEYTDTPCTVGTLWAKITVKKPFQSVSDEFERSLGINCGEYKFDSIQQIKENVQNYYNTAIKAYCDIIIK